MRLMCPNCEAQYEVSDSVIPLHGRDVQCSNCGQTWFQTHPQSEPEPIDDEDDLGGGDDSLTDVAAGAWTSDDTAGSLTPQEAELDPDSPAVITETHEVVATTGAAAAEPADFGADPQWSAAAAGTAVETSGDHLTSDLLAPGNPPASAVAPPMPDPHPSDGADPSAEPEPQPDAAPGPATPDKPNDDFAAVTNAAVTGEPRRRSLDDAVLSVLREEAEREAKARRAAGTLETQTDLNLSQSDPASRPSAGIDSLPKLRVQHQAESHVADLSSGTARRPVEDLSAPIEPDPAEIDSPAAHRHSRRDLLPDIEEFSSTLQADGGRAIDSYKGEPEPRRVKRGGFRTGFLLVVLLAAILLGLYAAAPALGAKFPAAAPALSSFVAQVDKGRVMIDQLMQSSLDKLNGDKPASE